MVEVPVVIGWIIDHFLFNSASTIHQLFWNGGSIQYHGLLYNWMTVVYFRHHCKGWILVSSVAVVEVRLYEIEVQRLVVIT